MSTPYKRLLEQHIGDRKVSQVAREWGVPAPILYEGLYENTLRPSAKYLSAIARGMGMTADGLLIALTPPEEDGRTAAGGQPSRKTSAIAS